jgi:hypothetical protein
VYSARMSKRELIVGFFCTCGASILHPVGDSPSLEKIIVHHEAIAAAKHARTCRGLVGPFTETRAVKTKLRAPKTAGRRTRKRAAKKAAPAKRAK